MVMDERSVLEAQGVSPWLAPQARQTVALRWIAVGMAGIIISLLLSIAGLHVIGPIFSDAPHCCQPLNIESNDISNAILIVSPIIAATAITIFLLVGIFRGYRSEDLGPSLTGTMARNLGSGLGAS